MHKALVAGASGLIGSRLIALLRGEPDYREIHALTRRPLGLEGSRLREHLVDFDALERAELGLDDVDDVFCALGTTIRTAGSREAFRRVDHDYVLAVGKLALRLGARRFLFVSSLGADERSTQFYLRVKGETEAALRALDLPCLCVFRPSLLKGPRREFRLGETLGNAAMGLAAPLLPKKLRPVADGTLARAMLAVARTDQGAFRIVESDEIQTLGQA